MNKSPEERFDCSPDKSREIILMEMMRIIVVVVFVVVVVSV